MVLDGLVLGLLSSLGLRLVGKAHRRHSRHGLVCAAVVPPKTLVMGREGCAAVGLALIRPKSTQRDHLLVKTLPQSLSLLHGAELGGTMVSSLRTIVDDVQVLAKGLKVVVQRLGELTQSKSARIDPIRPKGTYRSTRLVGDQAADTLADLVDSAVRTSAVHALLKLMSRQAKHRHATAWTASHKELSSRHRGDAAVTDPETVLRALTIQV